MVMKVGAEQAGKNRVFDSEHAVDFVPAVFCRIEPGGEEIVKMKAARAAATISFQPPGMAK